MITKYIGIGCYFTATLAVLILSIFIHKKDQENFAKKVYFASICFTSFTNLVNTIISVISIKSILKSISYLGQYEPAFRVDQGTFILHAVLLILLTIILFAYALPQEVYNRNENNFSPAHSIILYLILIANFMYQLVICYICFTIGSSRLLRNRMLSIT